MKKRRAKAPAKASPPSGKLATEVKELREWKRRLSLLLEYTRKISARKDLGSLLRLLVDASTGILLAERCTIFLLDKKKNELWSRMASGDQIIRVPAGKGIVGEAVSKNLVINIPDAYADPRFNPEVDKITGFRTRNLLTAPMRNNRNEVIGAFQMLNKPGNGFDQDDEQMLTLFADQAATAVENAQLYESIRAAAKDTIFRLASAAEYKDHDTGNHLERMSRYSAFIAEEMGMPRDWCQNLLLASPMHDIGKLGVPDRILQKPGRLDDGEWEEMKKHPLYGADILGNSESELLQMSERVARAHHEKFDGSGYPLGLRGEEIPVEARIVALADVFDALTSRRCYKPSFSMEDTLKIINDGAGKHFDPKVIEGFHKALPRIVQVMEQFIDRHDGTPANGAAVPASPATH